MNTHLTRALAGTVVTALTVALLALTGPPATAAATATTPQAQYAKAAVKATNTARRHHGRRPLRTSACLQRYAARQAARMAAQRRMFHQSLRGPLYGCDLRLAGENVAEGFRTGRGVVRNGWMKSPPHRENLLDRRFRLVAVAARKGPDGRWYASQVFGRR